MAQVPQVSIDDARAWFLGLGLGASAGVQSRAVQKLLARVRGGGVRVHGNSDSAGDSTNTINAIDSLTITLHAHCIADTADGLGSYLSGLMNKVGGLTLSLLINRPMYVPLLNGTTIEVTAVTAAVMWENSPAKLRLLFSYGGRVDLCDSGGLYLDERLPLLPYVNHIALYGGVGAGMTAISVDNGDTVSREGRMARRRTEDCVDICREIRYLAGEEDAPDDWRVPDVLSYDLVPGHG